MARVLLVTPPFTQLNTPYPATACLQGYLVDRGVAAAQADLGIELIDRLFSAEGLTALFAGVDPAEKLSYNASRIYALKELYIQVVDDVMAYLQKPSVEKAYFLSDTDHLPEAGRFDQKDDGDWLFGSMGVMDRAKHCCTLFLEDLADFISEVIDPYFGFSRYAERLGRSASVFDDLYQALQQPPSFIDELLTEITGEALIRHRPDLVAITIPFPGNLFGALRIGQYIKHHYPGVKIAWGGGYPNTELRALKDKRVFEFTDFITLDDGELPLERLIRYVDGECREEDLHRCFLISEGELKYVRQDGLKDIPVQDWGTPDYTGLPMEKYLSVLEVANPMFRLWSDGRWLKMTLAHGCYWGKCTFCDGSLDYIARYEPAPIITLVDRMEQMMRDTGLSGFHFVDEAAPPNLLKGLALELLRRRMKVTWWTNIRFERNFTSDLCRLLKKSGCIAVSGGLEVASDRILKLINKGVDIPQVTRVCSAFKEAGIMVHAYLMYGFPGQTEQETIDALEVVRQLFDLGLLTSGFWHQFAMTAHSDVGLNPDRYGVFITDGLNGPFANNDLCHVDPEGADHELFGEGLKKALYNFMHEVGLEWPVQEWFEFKVPKTMLPPNYLKGFLKTKNTIAPKGQWLWTGTKPVVQEPEKRKGQHSVAQVKLIFHSADEVYELRMNEKLARWVMQELCSLSIGDGVLKHCDEVRRSFEDGQLGSFEAFMMSHTFKHLRKAGLLLL